MNKHTPGPWKVHPDIGTPAGTLKVAPPLWASTGRFDIPLVAAVYGRSGEQEANARLISAAPDQHAEMLRYLPVLERAEADPELWARLTEGLGIATLNGYRAAIAKATGKAEEVEG